MAIEGMDAESSRLKLLRLHAFQISVLAPVQESFLQLIILAHTGTELPVGNALLDVPGHLAIRLHLEHRILRTLLAAGNQLRNS